MAHIFHLAARRGRQAAALTGAALLMLCGVAVAQGASGAGSQVVATVGDQKVTQAELENFAASGLAKLRQERQNVLEQGLDRYLTNQVLEREAKAQGMSVDDLLKKEIGPKVTPPTDADVDSFYEQNKNRISGTKEQLAGRIKDYLMQQRQQQAVEQYTDTLKKKYDVKVMLEPLRLVVDAKDAPSRGPANAPVTIVEFGDFECPYCGNLEPTLEKVLKDYAGKVRFVFRQYPLNSIHPLAAKASEAAMCANEQGKFWELHDRMYAHQDALKVDDLKMAAAELGLKTDRFDKCLDSDKYQKEIDADLKAGEQAGVNGTPALYVNGRPVPGGAVAYDVLAKVIDDELARVGNR